MTDYLDGGPEPSDYDLVDDDMDLIEKHARLIRLIAIRGYYKNGDLTKEDAIELLQGPLTPGDDNSIRDDSEWLEADGQAILEAFDAR